MIHFKGLKIFVYFRNSYTAVIFSGFGVFFRLFRFFIAVQLLKKNCRILKKKKAKSLTCLELQITRKTSL